MGLASDNDYRWIGISGTLVIVGILAWLFLLGEPDEAQQALNAKFGVASERSPGADLSAKDAQAASN